MGAGSNLRFEGDHGCKFGEGKILAPQGFGDINGCQGGVLWSIGYVGESEAARIVQFKLCIDLETARFATC